jgi:hypothetical protein
VWLLLSHSRFAFFEENENNLCHCSKQETPFSFAEDNNDDPTSLTNPKIESQATAESV